MRLLWLAPLALATSIGVSLLVVWGVSRLADFTFDPSVVAALSAAVCGTALVMDREGKRNKTKQTVQD